MKPLEFREKQLKALMRLYVDNTERIIEALNKDLGRCRMEASVLEVEYIKNDLQYLLENLRTWAKPERVSFLY